MYSSNSTRKGIEMRIAARRAAGKADEDQVWDSDWSSDHTPAWETVATTSTRNDQIDPEILRLQTDYDKQQQQQQCQEQPQQHSGGFGFPVTSQPNVEINRTARPSDQFRYNNIMNPLGATNSSAIGLQEQMYQDSDSPPPYDDGPQTKYETPSEYFNRLTTARQYMQIETKPPYPSPVKQPGENAKDFKRRQDSVRHAQNGVERTHKQKFDPNHASYNPVYMMEWWVKEDKRQQANVARRAQALQNRWKWDELHNQPAVAPPDPPNEYGTSLHDLAFVKTREMTARKKQEDRDQDKERIAFAVDQEARGIAIPGRSHPTCNRCQICCIRRKACDLKTRSWYPCSYCEERGLYCEDALTSRRPKHPSSKVASSGATTHPSSRNQIPNMFYREERPVQRRGQRRRLLADQIPLSYDPPALLRRSRSMSPPLSPSADPCNNCRETLSRCNKQRPCHNCSSRGLSCEASTQDGFFGEHQATNDDAMDLDDDNLYSGSPQRTGTLGQVNFVNLPPANNTLQDAEMIRKYHVAAWQHAHNPQTPSPLRPLQSSSPILFAPTHQIFAPFDRILYENETDENMDLVPHIYDRAVAAANSEPPFGGIPNTAPNPWKVYKVAQRSWGQSLCDDGTSREALARSLGRDQPDQPTQNLRPQTLMGESEVEALSRMLTEEINREHSFRQQIVHPPSSQEPRDLFPALMSLGDREIHENLLDGFKPMRNYDYLAFILGSNDMDGTCLEHANNFFPQQGDYQHSICGRDGDKHCDTLTHAQPWMTCDACHDIQNVYFAQIRGNNPSQEQVIKATKAYICLDCTAKLKISPGIAKQYRCICTSTMRKAWLCHIHREMITRKIYAAAPAFDEWMLRAFNGQIVCAHCYSNAPGEDAYGCKVCREWVLPG